MLTPKDKEDIEILYCVAGYHPEEIAEELDLDELEVMEYCDETLRKTYA